MNEVIAGLRKALFVDNPEIEARIQHGTELYRKGTAEFVVQNEKGEEVQAEIDLKLSKHEFQFGCNGFMINQLDTEEKRAAHDKAFSDLFNLAVVPFYWSDAEPEDGNPRFGKDSSKIWRRPNTDECLEFCEKYNISPKGHPLMWHAFIPEWLEGNQMQLKLRWERRVREIAERYGTRITNWDVINEVVDERQYVEKLPTDPVDFAFDIARKYLPEAVTLNYNDYACWTKSNGRATRFYAFVKRLMDEGKKVDCLGLQYHLFVPQPEKMIAAWANEKLDPANVYQLMDLYGSLGKPLNISEVTFIAHEGLGEERLDFQADVAEKMYRIWFSHPSNIGIIYWNLVDGTAYQRPNGNGWDENIYRGGLLNNDAQLSHKPVYDRLYNLIKKEWQSVGTVKCDKDAPSFFRGFYGEYDATVKTNSGSVTKKIRIEKNRENKITIKI